MFNPIEEANKAIQNANDLLFKIKLPNPVEKAKGITTNPIEDINNTIDNVNNTVQSVNSVTDKIASVIEFFTKCFTDPASIIDKIQLVAPDFIVIILLVLIVLRFLGFEDTNKWILLTLSIALLLAIL